MGALRTVAAGDALPAPAVTRRVIEAFADHAPPPRRPAALDELTARELEVLRHLARGSRTPNRPRVRRRGVDGQDACRPGPDEAGAARSRARGDLRLRVRARPPRVALRAPRAPPTASARAAGNVRPRWPPPRRRPPDAPRSSSGTSRRRRGWCRSPAGRCRSSTTGIRDEHVAVRTAAGVFDVSHMGQIETSGPQAGALLQRLLSNDVDALAVGGAQYALLCREDGGVLDDLLTYRLGPDRYLTVANAANHARDVAWFRHHAAASTPRWPTRPSAGRCSPSRARAPARPCRPAPTRRCRRAARRPSACSPGARRSCAAPATRARTASRSCAPPTTPPRCGTS